MNEAPCSWNLDRSGAEYHYSYATRHLCSMLQQGIGLILNPGSSDALELFGLFQ